MGVFGFVEIVVMGSVVDVFGGDIYMVLVKMIVIVICGV